VTSKRCTTCGETKELSGFDRDKSCKDGHRHRCKACRAHPHERAKDRRRKTGVSKELFNALLIKQENRCAICTGRVDNSAAADHCHDTKAPRGILCRACNLGLGLMKDDLGNLIRAVAYLHQPPATPMLIRFASDMTEERLRATAVQSGLIQIP
jgi:recombination endonuclease VII